MGNQVMRCFRWLVVGFVGLAIFPGWLPAAELELLQPAEINPSQVAGGKQAPDRSSGDPRHVIRRARIRLLDGFVASAGNLVPGDAIKVKIFADRNYRIIVDVRERDRFGSEKITGHIEGAQDQTFIMIFSEEDFVISLQDVASGTTYYLSGKTGNAQGEVVEVDDRQRPRRIQ